jgi:hypothetical protein
MHASIVLMSVLRVLWMSTHGCFATSFPHTRLLRPDDGAQEQEIPGGTYYYIEPADKE